MVRAAQGSRRVGSSPCSASDCLCDLGQHTFSPLPGSLAIYEMSSAGQLVALNQGKASELPIVFCNIDFWALSPEILIQWVWIWPRDLR